jgi:hypothetical protein
MSWGFAWGENWGGVAVGTGAATLSFEASAAGAIGAKPPQKGNVSGPGYDLVKVLAAFRDGRPRKNLRKQYRVKRFSGTGAAILSIVANGEGSHVEPNRAKAVAVITISGAAKGEFFDAVADDNRFMMFAA